MENGSDCGKILSLKSASEAFAPGFGIILDEYEEEFALIIGIALKVIWKAIANNIYYHSTLH